MCPSDAEQWSRGLSCVIVVVQRFFTSNPFHIGFIYRHMEGGHATEGLFGQYDPGIELGKGSFVTCPVSGKQFTNLLGNGTQ